jgi:histone-lysine N-methyltransferase SETD2
VIADIVVKEAGSAGSKGKGVFALRDFGKGEFIFRRRHERVISNAEIPFLSEEERHHLCELDFETSAVLLPPGCYLNHSCDPNAMRSGVKVFAWRDIGRGDEITIDYRLNAFGTERWKCDCGSGNCSGEVIGSFFSLDLERQRRYLPHAPRFIQREYGRRLASWRLVPPSPQRLPGDQGVGTPDLVT